MRCAHRCPRGLPALEHGCLRVPRLQTPGLLGRGTQAGEGQTVRAWASVKSSFLVLNSQLDFPGTSHLLHLYWGEKKTDESIFLK